MTLHVLQKGQGTTRPLIAAFGPMAAAKLPKLLGPAPCIVFDPDGHGTETMAQVVDFASHHASFGAVSGTALIGFSIGCSRVRKLRIEGATAGAYLLVDGTHASWPPQAWQIAWLRDLAALASGGKSLVVASHTYQTYTEKIPGNPFASTVTVLRQATGFPLLQGGPPDAPILSRAPLTGPPTSGLWVYSYASKAADYEAHKYQGGPALHALVAAHLAPWVTTASSSAPGSPAASRTLLVGDSHAAGLTAPLRARALTSGGELAARAINGSTIDQWAHGGALAESLTQARPASVLVSLGTNDLAAKPADYKRALIGAIVARIRTAGSKVAWILPPRMALPDRGGLRPILADELARLGVPAFDSEALDLPTAADGVHLTPTGYQTWAALIATWKDAQLRPGTPGPQPTSPSAPGWRTPAANANTSDLGPLALLGAAALVLGS